MSFQTSSAIGEAGILKATGARAAATAARAVDCRNGGHRARGHVRRNALALTAVPRLLPHGTVLPGHRG